MKAQRNSYHQYEFLGKRSPSRPYNWLMRRKSIRRMAQDLRRRLGRRVRELRQENQLTQEALAERAGISWHFVSGIERAATGATLETLSSIAAAFGISLSELMLGVDRPAPRELRRL